MAPVFAATSRDLAILAALAVPFVALTLLVAIGPDPLPGESAFIRRLQDRTSWARDAAEFIRLTTGTTGAVVILAAFTPYFIWRHGPWILLPVAIGLITVYAFQPGLKELIDRARPDESQVDVLANWTSKAYPSGHAIGMTMATGYVAWLGLFRWQACWLALVVLLIPATVFSGLVQGVHWPTDLLGGMLFGGIAVWAMALTTPADAGRSGSVSSTG